jgi:hypothetical protein
MRYLMICETNYAYFVLFVGCKRQERTCFHPNLILSIKGININIEYSIRRTLFKVHSRHFFKYSKVIVSDYRNHDKKKL